MAMGGQKYADGPGGYDRRPGSRFGQVPGSRFGQVPGSRFGQVPGSDTAGAPSRGMVDDRPEVRPGQGPTFGQDPAPRSAKARPPVRPRPSPTFGQRPGPTYVHDPGRNRTMA